MPEAGEPYFNFNNRNDVGIIYKYKNTREKIVVVSKKILNKLLKTNVISKYQDKYIYTPYVLYLENGSKYKQACRIDLSSMTTKKDELRINCTRIKYEYGFQAGSIHNLFTKTWWGKNASDLEIKLLSLLKNEDI